MSRNISWSNGVQELVTQLGHQRWETGWPRPPGHVTSKSHWGYLLSNQGGSPGRIMRRLSLTSRSQEAKLNKRKHTVDIAIIWRSYERDNRNVGHRLKDSHIYTSPDVWLMPAWHVNTVFILHPCSRTHPSPCPPLPIHLTCPYSCWNILQPRMSACVLPGHELVWDICCKFHFLHRVSIVHHFREHGVTRGGKIPSWPEWSGQSQRPEGVSSETITEYDGYGGGQRKETSTENTRFH